MSDAKNNPHVAAIYRAMALRFYLRYVDARCEPSTAAATLSSMGIFRPSARRTMLTRLR